MHVHEGCSGTHSVPLLQQPIRVFCVLAVTSSNWKLAYRHLSLGNTLPLFILWPNINKTFSCPVLDSLSLWENPWDGSVRVKIPVDQRFVKPLGQPFWHRLPCHVQSHLCAQFSLNSRTFYELPPRDWLILVYYKLKPNSTKDKEVTLYPGNRPNNHLAIY